MKNQERIIYNSYDLWEDYHDAARDILAENGNQDPSDADIWEEIYFRAELNWEDELERLQSFFDGSQWLESMERRPRNNESADFRFLFCTGGGAAGAAADPGPYAPTWSR